MTIEQTQHEYIYSLWRALKHSTRINLGYKHVAFCITAGIPATYNRKRLVTSYRDFATAAAYADLLKVMRSNQALKWFKPSEMDQFLPQ